MGIPGDEKEDHMTTATHKQAEEDTQAAKHGHRADDTQATPPEPTLQTTQPLALAFYSQQADCMDYYNSGATVINAGDVVVMGPMLGVATHFINPSSWGALVLEGAFDFAKKAGDVAALGATLWWDGTNKYATSTSAGNTVIGKAIKAAVAGDARVRVKLIIVVP
jgi:predicted RecA/RadA family phage recombinase